MFWRDTGTPTGRKSADAISNVKACRWVRKAKQASSDDAPDLVNARAELKINHVLCLPSLAERFTTDWMMENLARVGLPMCCWVHANAALCHLMNVEEGNGSSERSESHCERLRGWSSSRLEAKRSKEETVQSGKAENRSARAIVNPGLNCA